MESKRMRVLVLLIAVVLAVTAAGQGQRGQQRQGRGGVVVDPQGWVLIGYDYDQDQRIDAYEYIHVYDLERAREMTRQRPQGRERAQMRQAPGRQRPQARAPRGRQQWFGAGQYPGMPAPGRQMQVTGTVQQTRQIRLARQQQPHTFAKVQTREGRTVVVDLGPASKANQLNLSQGDQIEARGRVSKVNERPVLMAGQVRANDQTISVQRARGTETRRLEGTITRLATRPLEGPDRPPHVVALVELETGQTVPVDLGRRQDLQDVPIRQGKDITLLVRTARIGDRRILVAQSMGIDGRRIDVQWLRRARQHQQPQASGRQARR